MADYFAGIDIGSTMTKAVILGEGIIASVIGPTGPEQRRLANRVMEDALGEAGIPFDSITYIISTGYGRINVPFADRQVTEISCHAKGISHLFPRARTIIDIGGQDSKAIRVGPGGRPSDFVMNDKCAAGSGRFVEVIADTLGIRLEDMGKVSLESTNPAPISSICTIWAQQEVAASQAKGIPIPDLVAGVHRSLADRVVRMAKRIRIEQEIILTGGGAKNIGLVKAMEAELGQEVLVPDEPLITGALGAALLGKDMADKALKSGRPLETKERVLEEIQIL
ncbi:MAG: 2-hydroxyglutaryl-CoA dehydratase [Deltaproteobacteria bacterium]|nr:2-hydroxyglutaryl-CoA dehydratase [Deltaproteobacteria bacterium]MBW2016656.1 2-hydroxyglutaryl-CoA dehydratase [Deltaproteobacteria bacterium]MBW2128812.1 2-hydroxyglutaryl-CoA dehydratase [Deltaproteobacteria bacterium]MBW2303764.1 2-hydroxyglutaryl-CoA dehydratase [Deltaproteobacteria bacterium]